MQHKIIAEQADQHQSKEVAIYNQEGACILKKILKPQILEKARSEIEHIVGCLTGKRLNISQNGTKFSEKITELLFAEISKDPNKRGVLYSYIQKIPGLFQVAGNDNLLAFSKNVGICHPSVKEAKVQMFLPWEKMFFQDCHQDINSLGSSRSVTFWIPMQNLFEHTAVRYWVGSHNEGPVVHEVAKEDPVEGIFLERVPFNIQAKYPVIKTGTAEPGDVIAINRLTFHQSPDFAKQLFSRWSFVIRYDDLETEFFSENETKYESFTPYPSSKQSIILQSIKEKLKQKPNPNWRLEKNHAN